MKIIVKNAGKYNNLNFENSLEKQPLFGLEVKGISDKNGNYDIENNKIALKLQKCYSKFIKEVQKLDFPNLRPKI